MFRSIAFGSSSLPVQNIGDLAECLFFYKKVHVLIDHQGFKRLARIMGIDTLLGLIEDDHLAITYLENRPAISTQIIGNTLRHGFHTIQAVGKDAQTLIPKLCVELTGKAGRGRRLSQRILRRIERKSYDAPELSSIVEGIKRTEYTDRLAPQILMAEGMSDFIPVEPRFRVHEIEGGFVVDTNLDFLGAGAKYPERGFNSATVMEILFHGRAEVNFAAGIASELVPVPSQAVVAREVIASTIESHVHSLERSTLFCQKIVKSNTSVAELIDSGSRSFEDLRSLLAKARPFKQWLQNQEADADLVQAYIDEVNRVGWQDAQRTKVLRFVLFQLPSLLPGASGLVASAADSFIVDKLLGGWRPHQFVRGALREFRQVTK